MNHQNFVKTISMVLNLSKTDKEIIKTLFTEKGGLLVHDITYKIKRSERNVRYRLDSLLKKGLLKREIEVLNNRRLAYRYFIESKNRFIEEAKNLLFKRINELNKLQIITD